MWLDLKADDATSLVLYARVIDDPEMDVVVEIGNALLDDSEGETKLIDRRSSSVHIDKSLFDGSRKIVEDPLISVHPHDAHHATKPLGQSFGRGD